MHIPFFSLTSFLLTSPSSLAPEFPGIIIFENELSHVQLTRSSRPFPTSQRGLVWKFASVAKFANDGSTDQNTLNEVGLCEGWWDLHRCFCECEFELECSRDGHVDEDWTTSTTRVARHTHTSPSGGSSSGSNTTAPWSDKKPGSAMSAFPYTSGITSAVSL